jgi:hypothetical protein
MQTELRNFIMLGTDAEGNDYTIEMTDLETALYKDSGYCKYYDAAEAVWEMACQRCGIEYGDMPDMITEEEVA